MKKKQIMKTLRIFSMVAVILSFLPININGTQSVNTVEAAASNLIVDGSFNKTMTDSWYLWKDGNSTREYTLARSYEAPFGYGPYSMAIKASGSAGNSWDGGIASIDANRFEVKAGSNYSFSFYAKASSPTSISINLENTTDYQALTSKETVSIDGDWKKYQITFSPNNSGLASLGINFGSLANGATLYLDNLTLFENDATLKTSVVKGYIGDSNKYIYTINGNLFTTDQIEIELPYVNPQTGVVSTKRFKPSNKKSETIYFTMPENTYSGIGKVYGNGSLIGQFEYQVLIKIEEVSPNPVMVTEDLVIHGTGFSPDKEQNFVIVKAINTEGKLTEQWIKPYLIDNSLKQMVIKLPTGIANGSLQVRNYYNNVEGTGVEMKSNSVSYNIKPVIYSLNWSQAGYEQIGDKITITGKGIVNRPSVKFYDETGKLVSSAYGSIVSINDSSETIEVKTPTKLNKLQVTVKVGNYESEKADALNYIAKPILKSISSGKSRRLADSSTNIAAAKASTTIKIYGQGLSGTNNIYVEFPSLNGVVKAYIPAESISSNGSTISVVVPNEAQSGQIYVVVNNEKSNPLPLEIIPSVISSTPLIPSPGQEMTFWTNGVGLDEDLATVNFKLNNKETVKVKPTSLTKTEYGSVIVKVLAPRAIASDGSTISVQYGYWTSAENYDLETAPQIQRASIDTDTKILTIYGHGFSNTASENKINYKYADGTVVDTEARISKITTTAEGQELSIKIYDDYYYGYVSVTVNGQTSNEANVGPAVITRIDRRVQFVAAENRVMGVIYLSGRNFGTNGDVKVGDSWAKTHYRSNTFIIAVVEQNQINSNPIIVTKNQ